MTSEQVAAEYVNVIDVLHKLARALAEGRWNDGAAAAWDLSAAGDHLANAAAAAGYAEVPVTPGRLRGDIVRRLDAGVSDPVRRRFLELLDPVLATIDPDEDDLDHELPPDAEEMFPPPL